MRACSGGEYWTTNFCYALGYPSGLPLDRRAILYMAIPVHSFLALIDQGTIVPVKPIPGVDDYDFQPQYNIYSRLESKIVPPGVLRILRNYRPPVQIASCPPIYEDWLTGQAIRLIQQGY